MKRVLSVAPTRHLLALVGLALAATVGSLSAADHYYVNDHLATTTAVADAAGEIAAIEADAFGTPVAGAAQAARYTGKPYDDDIGAFVFPFRNYRSDEARWMSADPSGFPDGTNGTAYMAQPNRSVDPLGLVVVNSFMDVLNYYASGAGGSVDAGASLIADVKTSPGYASMMTSLGNTLSSKIASASFSETSGTISGSGTRSLSNTGLTLGGVALNINYSASWSSFAWQSVSSTSESRGLHAINTPYNFTFSDPWDFVPNSTYSALQNLFGETIPGAIAATYSMVTNSTTGRPFTINGSFTDLVSGAATQTRARE